MALGGQVVSYCLFFRDATFPTILRFSFSLRVKKYENT